ncbi:MAG TPA: short chain dehydrogenase, partial [Cellvibrionales bacterium]|nr:short chain dehydrogenase [Cellvibrionales bacterium]
MAGKTVLVTAAAGAGIGFAAAKRAAEEGATALMIADIHEGRLAKSADKLEQETGLRPYTQLCNVTDENDVQSLLANAVDKMGHIDILINNA